VGEPGAALEGLGLSFWRNRRVLLTGHTGFKGSWLCLWLERLGAQVTGLALPPHTDPNLFTLLSPWPALDHRVADLTVTAPTAQLIADSKAEVLIHLAAQALVPAGHCDPVGTFAANVMGTVHVLQGALALPALKAALIVTTDKVYANPDSGRPFAESDPLGGTEPYGSSKAAAEFAVDAYRASFAAKKIGLGTARAGNVIGGGDWSADRLVPDLVRALWSGQPAILRNPESVRPWQHVLDPLSGYLLYAERLALAPESAPPALNFAPSDESTRRVIDVVDRFVARFNDHPRWQPAGEPSYREAAILRLSAAKAQATLGWRPRLDFDAAVAWTTDWHAAHRHGDDMRKFSLSQIERYEALG
jgi:CDP-glucose 4,6-dehydratase